jgi:ribonucleoside-diphosphate reductase alpha chain
VSDVPRTKLPDKRPGFNQEARVGGHKIIIRTGEYEDGKIGELFIDMHKQGSAFRSVMHCLAMSVSLGLQYGVPLDHFVRMFVGTKFEPNGTVTGHDRIREADSLVDYVFRALGLHYLEDREDLAEPPKKERWG